MPRGIPGSGPNAGRGKGRKTKTHTLADIAARGPNAGQQASAGATTGSAAAAATGKGRSGKGRTTAGKNARRGGRSPAANNGHQRADQGSPKQNGDGGTQAMTPATEVGGVKIEVMSMPGRGGRPQQAEAFPFAALEVSTKGEGGEITGPSFLIPDDQNPDNVLAAARKRHKGKTFSARKTDGGVRIWRLS